MDRICVILRHLCLTKNDPILLADFSTIYYDLSIIFKV